MSEETGTLRWGVVGSGRICHDFVVTVQSLPAEEHLFAAVADISLDAAERFAADHNIPLSYGSHEELALNAAIDVVYIGVINPFHFAAAKLFIEAGKHVLCEKPMTLSTRDTKTLTALAQEKGVFLMEGLWSTFLPGTQFVLDQVENSAIFGQLRHVSIVFGEAVTCRERCVRKALGGGVIGDLAIYGLNLLNLLFGTPEKVAAVGPEKVAAVGDLNEDGVEETAVVSFGYGGGRTASLASSVRCRYENEAVLYGTKGVIVIRAPFHGTEVVEVNGREFRFPFPEVDAQLFHGKQSMGLTFEADEVRRCILRGILQSPKASHATSLSLAELSERIFAQIAGNPLKH